MKSFIKWPMILLLFFIPVMCASCNGCGQGGFNSYNRSYEDMTGKHGDITIIRVDQHLQFTDCTIVQHTPNTMSWYFEYTDKTDDKKVRRDFYWQGEVLFEPALPARRSKSRPARTYQTYGTKYDD